MEKNIILELNLVKKYVVVYMEIAKIKKNKLGMSWVNFEKKDVNQFFFYKIMKKMYIDKLC